MFLQVITMSSGVLVEFRDIAVVEIGTEMDYFLPLLKKILTDTYITNYKETNEVMVNFSGFQGAVADIIAMLREEMTWTRVSREGRAVTNTTTMWMYPITTAKKEHIDITIYPGPEIPYIHPKNPKKLRKLTRLQGAKSIRFDYTEMVYKSDDDYEGEAVLRTFDSTGDDPHIFKHRYFKRYDEVHQYDEWHYREKFTTRARKKHFPDTGSVLSKMKTSIPVQRFAKAFLCQTKGFRIGKVDVYHVRGGYVGFKFHIIKRGDAIKKKIGNPIHHHHEDLSLKELIAVRLKDKDPFGKTLSRPKGKIKAIGNFNRDSFWVVTKEKIITDHLIDSVYDYLYRAAERAQAKKHSKGTK